MRLWDTGSPWAQTRYQAEAATPQEGPWQGSVQRPGGLSLSQETKKDRLSVKDGTVRKAGSGGSKTARALSMHGTLGQRHRCRGTAVRW